MLEIRDCTAADITAVTGVYAHHVLHGLATFEETPPDEAEMLSRFQSVKERGLPYLVALNGGAIVGYAYAAPYRLRSAYRYALEDSIYISADFQGRGVGKALLSELIQRCEAWGGRQMIAIIGDSANRASIALHERLGFEHAGLFKSVGFKFGRWVDSVLMQRPLGAGSSDLP